MPESLHLGEYHPLLQAGELFRLQMDRGKVARLDVDMGTSHRGIEKIAETKSWDQLPTLFERICGFCSASHPAAAVRAMEELGNIVTPERAQYIRTLACELERVQSHLVWFGLIGHLMGYQSLWMWTWKYREELRAVSERMCGSRQLSGLFKIGGVRRDIDEEMFPWIFERLGRFAPVLELLDDVLSGDPIFKVRTRGVGVLSRETVTMYGVVGPAARASGVAIDVRKDDPYFAYPWVDWNLALRTEGDIHAKAEVRLFEMRESLDIVRQCLDRMKPGPIETYVKGLPAGTGIGRVEAPRGELFHCLVGDGTHVPIRYQIRAPSFVNIFSLQATLIGEDIDDAVLALAAVDPCTACTERMIVVGRNDPVSPILSVLDLVRRSHKKIKRLTAVC